MPLAALRRLLRALLLVATGGVLLFACTGAFPPRFVAPPLDLTAPINAATGRQIAALADDPARCVALLDAARAGVRRASPVTSADSQCGYADGVRVASSNGVAWRPGGRVTSCPVAAALFVWEREVVRPAALAQLGSRVTAIDHFGSYSCRRIGGAEGGWSEHARANAIDIAGFRLADGRRVSVARDWAGDDPSARFLRQARDGACRLFGTTLSPDYNAAHADHLHLDQARRGGGWFGGYCR